MKQKKKRNWPLFVRAGGNLEKDVNPKHVANVPLLFRQVKESFLQKNISTRLWRFTCRRVGIRRRKKKKKKNTAPKSPEKKKKNDQVQEEEVESFILKFLFFFF
eukprot:TRINITY_DN4169_c1_g1_i2.p2 TRINITY_DN4169_c1_g1~~TRINITY_DN4169_c1_g1_i2.p2  ORF type:complete len:104 (-),score=16.84 TRINITY_DN4169_c1_g1_i2:387-698(-)